MKNDKLSPFLIIVENALIKIIRFVPLTRNKINRAITVGNR